MNMRYMQVVAVCGEHVDGCVGDTRAEVAIKACARLQRYYMHRNNDSADEARVKVCYTCTNTNTHTHTHAHTHAHTHTHTHTHTRTHTHAHTHTHVIIKVMNQADEIARRHELQL